MGTYIQNYLEYRRRFEPGYEIPKGFHVHHIVPRSVGGTDEGPNMMAMHIDDHKTIHRLRGDKCVRDKFWAIAGVSRKGEENGFYNKHHTNEVKAHLSKAMMGNKHLEGHIHTEKTKQTLSEKADRQERTCPHCGKSGSGTIMFRWHFDNCKKRT